MEVKKEIKEEKKFEKVKKEENKQAGKIKNKKNLYYIISIVIAICLIALIAFVILTLQQTPEKLLNNILSNLKEGNLEKINQYINYEEILGTSNLLSSKEFNEETKKTLFNKLEWEILEVKTEKDKAVVNLEITNKDFKIIIEKYMQKALSAVFSGKNLENDEIKNYLVEEINNQEAQIITQTKTLEFTKKDNKWQITVNDELIDALLPNLQKTVDSLNNNKLI